MELTLMRVPPAGAKIITGSVTIASGGSASVDLGGIPKALFANNNTVQTTNPISYALCPAVGDKIGNKTTGSYWEAVISSGGFTVSQGNTSYSQTIYYMAVV